MRGEENKTKTGLSLVFDKCRFEGGKIRPLEGKPIKCWTRKSDWSCKGTKVPLLSPVGQDMLIEPKYTEISGRFCYSSKIALKDTLICFSLPLQVSPGKGDHG